MSELREYPLRRACVDGLWEGICGIKCTGCYPAPKFTTVSEFYAHIMTEHVACVDEVDELDRMCTYWNVLTNSSLVCKLVEHSTWMEEYRDNGENTNIIFPDVDCSAGGMYIELLDSVPFRNECVRFLTSKEWELPDDKKDGVLQRIAYDAIGNNEIFDSRSGSIRFRLISMSILLECKLNIPAALTTYRRMQLYCGMYAECDVLS